MTSCMEKAARLSFPSKLMSLLTNQKLPLASLKT